MQKTLQKIQAENRRLILEAVHGCSYEQAVSKELTKGCKIDYTYIQKGVCGQQCPPTYYGFVEAIEENGDIYLECGKTLKKRDYSIYIFPRPNSLARVLLTLADWIDDDGMYMTANKNLRFENIIWDLTKETLEDQSEETQRAINQLLTQ